MSRPQPDGLGTAISALYYEDGMRKPLTKRTLELIEETKANGGKAISFFLDGLVHFPTDEESAESLHRAAESGLDHPFLSYVLGECYRYGDKGVPKNIDRAIEWYKKAISGTSVLLSMYHPILICYPHLVNGNSLGLLTSLSHFITMLSFTTI